MTQPAHVIGVTAHARSVAARDRERFAAELQAALAGRGLLIETCHRVEAYAADDATNDRLATLDLPVGTRRLIGEPAIRHAMALAVGRDSVVVGEDQILHQVREAVETARRAAALNPIIERLFAIALRAGRQARSWRQGPERSLATVAVAEIERQTGRIAGRPVLIVGAGPMARLAARAAAARGANIRVASRTMATAIALARDVDGRAIAFDPGAEIREFAGTIVALAGPWMLADRTREALAPGQYVVDLSVPAAVPDDVAARLGASLITADDLARMDLSPAASGQSSDRFDQLVDRATAEFIGWLDDHDRRAAAEALALRADRAREAELDALWRRLPDADPETRAAIEFMTRHLAGRLLREPLERLAKDRDGTVERAVREAFAL